MSDRLGQHPMGPNPSYPDDIQLLFNSAQLLILPLILIKNHKSTKKHKDMPEDDETK